MRFSALLKALALCHGVAVFLGPDFTPDSCSRTIKHPIDVSTLFIGSDFMMFACSSPEPRQQRFRRACAQFRVRFDKTCNVGKVFLSLAGASLRIGGCPDFSLQRIFQCGDRQSDSQHFLHIWARLGKSA